MGKYIKSIFIAFVLILLIDNVNALSFSSSELGYNLDGTWTGYDSSNLSKSFSTPATKELSALNYRLTLNSYFQQDDYYNITFNLYMDYIYTSDFTLKDAINEMSNRNIKCYFTSSGSVQTADACFESYTFNISQVNVKQVKYNLSFVPKRNIYRILIQQESGEGSSLPTSYGWTTSNLSYTVEEDKTAGLIGETNEKLDSVNNNLNDINDNLTDDTPPDTTGLIDAPGWLPAGPVDSLITLPINLLQGLTNNLESACTPINLPIPFIDDNLTLDCPETLLRRFDGFWMFWETFGLIAGVWCLYKYFINLYKWVESHLSLDEQKSLGKWGGV